jgi:N-methylhydantoinase B
VRTELDPILLEVLRNAFESSADQMALILMRTAHSPIVRDAMDFSTAVCDASGQNLAQGLTTPMHLGSFYDAMRHLITQFQGRIGPGDVFIGNDPYLASGQHLPDIYVIQPVFHGERLCAWAATIAHHVDVGGLVPGSNSLAAVEIHQEGLRLPFLKLADRGIIEQQLLEIIAANVRVPDQVLGDIHAQRAACLAGERELAALLARYGPDTVIAYGEALQDHSERLARAAIAQIPDGTYRFSDHLDGLGEDPKPIEFHVSVTVKGEELTVDWTGTSMQVKGGINAPLSFCKSNVYAALRSVMPAELPNCHGYTRPIHVIAPEGSLVNARYPAPCGARGITGYRIVDCIFGALAQALPDLVAADGAGGSTLPSFSGWQGNKRFVFSECIMGTWGATSRHDGQEGVPHMASNQANVPVEMIEADYPIRIERYGFAPDTGGPGKYRGGVSLVREYRMLADEVYFGVRSDKCIHSPHGLFGGHPGAPAMNELRSGTGRKILPPMPMEPITLRKGDVYRHVMAGGGGFGDPLDREPEQVRGDVLDGKVTGAHAQEAYGVVLEEGPQRQIDLQATLALRAARRSAGRGRVSCDADPFSPEFRADPYRHYAELRRIEAPIVWLTRHSIWVVSRYEPVRAVLNDWKRFSNAGGGGIKNYFLEKPWRQPSLILEVDPPEHQRTRKVLMQALAPARLQQLRSTFEREAEALVEEALERETLDAIPDLVQRFPLTVFPDAVGMPREDRSNLLTYGAMVFGGFGPVTPWYEELMKQAEAVTAWIMERCRREALSPDGMGAEIHAQADAGVIESWEAPLLVRSFLSAGVDTTIDSIGLCLRCLAEHPDQWALLRDNPSLARGAFEEATRYDSSSQSLFRTTLEDTEFEGVALGKHQKVLVLLGAAGRDPLKWTDPDRFDITRRVTASQLGYGGGIHSCVAQMMARLEAEVFFQVLARKVDRIELTGPAEVRLNPGLRGLTSLPVRLIRKSR